MGCRQVAGSHLTHPPSCLCPVPTSGYAARASYTCSATTGTPCASLAILAISLRHLRDYTGPPAAPALA